MSTTIWIATLATSFTCFALKFIGYSLPDSILNHPLIQRINGLIPIALLSALVAVQTFGSSNEIVVDHRFIGVLAAALALRLKANFPVMMLVAAVTSAMFYRI